MPLNVIRVAQAVQSGLSTVCATCTKYWEGRDRGLPGDTCTAATPCGSPLSGGDFHEYDGPMQAFEQFCFVCGEGVSALINKRGSARRFGLCTKHKQMVPSLRPVNMVRPFEQPVVVTGDGTTRTLDKILPPRKLSVFERIEETEEEFRKRDIERGLLPEPE